MYPFSTLQATRILLRPCPRFFGRSQTKDNLAGALGDYEFNCKLDRRFFDFTTINAIEFMEFVATGADDDEVARWITEHAVPRDRSEIVKWNNQMRELRISELPIASQLYLEDYIPMYIPSNKSVVTLFDVFDAEEGRI